MDNPIWNKVSNMVSPVKHWFRTLSTCQHHNVSLSSYTFLNDPFHPYLIKYKNFVLKLDETWWTSCYFSWWWTSSSSNASTVWISTLHNDSSWSRWCSAGPGSSTWQVVHGVWLHFSKPWEPCSTWKLFSSIKWHGGISVGNKHNQNHSKLLQLPGHQDFLHC